MMRKPRKVRRSPAAAGFTLVEVLACATLIVIGFVALVAAFGYESVVAQRGEEFATGTYLADEIRDMALRMTFADILDLNGTTYSPAVLSNGASAGASNWSQTIAVTEVSAANMNVAGTGAARITVTIKARSKPVVTLTYYVLDMTGVPFTDR